jgi:hypothetical protein
MRVASLRQSGRIWNLWIHGAKSTKALGELWILEIWIYAYLHNRSQNWGFV